MYTLYYSPGACSLSVHSVLEEIGVRFKPKERKIRKGQTGTPQFLAINPKARVPVLVDGDKVITEAIAILTYLAEKHPDAGLIAEPGTIARARCLEWMSFITSTLHPLYWGIWRPHRFSSDKKSYDGIYKTTESRLKDQYAFIDSHLAYLPYLLGDRVSVADFYLMVFALWARRIDLPVSGWPNLQRFLESMLARDSVQRAMAREGLRTTGELVA